MRLVEQEGLLSRLSTPLIKDGEAIGAIMLGRTEPGGFSEAEISLVETFAAQAVIAIENVLQFREVQEKLERERASAEILEVISQSRDDERPVFEKIVRATAQLLDSPTVGLALGRAGDKFLTMGAQIGAPEDAVRLFESGGALMDPEQSILARAVLSGRTENLPDMGVSTEYQKGYPVTRWMVDRAGVRSALFIPLLSGGQGIGALILFRTEVVPFTDDQIALVETFAAQAVIAIENVRQFREVQERLERERASAEILDVISRSRDDERPVFDAILENTAHLCETDLATFNLMNAEGTHLVYAAHYGRTLHTYEVGVDRWSIDSTLQIAESVREGQIVHNVDLRETQLYKEGDKWRRQLADEEGVRSFLTVPLIAADGNPIGCIGIYRKEVRAFSGDEILMVETFAAQAVIAIENVRQFREVQERLEREKASGEILTVISQSRDDELPVFDAILENALRLCAADMAVVNTANEAWTEVGYAAGIHSDGPEFQPGRNSWPIDSQQFVCRSIFENRTFHTPDLMDTDLYRSGDVTRRNLVDIEGMRTQLVLPLVQGDRAIASFSLYRKKMQPFSDAEISLLETFAAQAVIAIENVRQFKALETLNAELGDRVQDQVGEIERMGRLKRFLPSAVADAVVTSGDESMLTSHRALVATLFCDMRGFTAFCESAEPEETIEVLQTYHQEMSDLIDEYGGGVDQRAGDGIMVIFNDPVPVDDPAGDAVRLAVAMRAKMRELCAKWKRLGYRLGFGVGVSLGYATVGMVGSAGRFDYTASGTSVNTAARLCDMAADGEVLISPRVWVAVEGEVQAESRGEVQMKGIREPIELFAVN